MKYTEYLTLLLPYKNLFPSTVSVFQREANNWERGAQWNDGIIWIYRKILIIPQEVSHACLVWCAKWFGRWQMKSPSFEIEEEWNTKARSGWNEDSMEISNYFYSQGIIMRWVYVWWVCSEDWYFMLKIIPIEWLNVNLSGMREIIVDD